MSLENKGGHCSVPLHTPLTDYIQASGGSSELITILNRLGGVASRENLDRNIVGCQLSVSRRVCRKVLMVNPLLLPPLTTLISSRAMFQYTLVVSTIVGMGPPCNSCMTEEGRELVQ